MLKNPKKADLDKDGKLSSYEKKRGMAVEKNMKAKKPSGALNQMLAAGKAKAKKGKMMKAIHPTDHPDVKMTKKIYAKNKIYAGSDEEVAKDLDKLQNKIARKRTKTEGSFFKGGEMKRGYGAARTSGMGLQDEELIPGKSLDYYKDLI